VQRAHELVVADEHLVEKHLVELGVAGELHEWAHLDAGRLHVDHEIRDALCFGTSASVRARQSPAGELRVRRPDLLPERSQPSSTRTARVESERGRNPRRLAEELAPDLSAVRIAGSQRCFCSSVPCASKVGPQVDADALIGCSARDRAYSMLKIATCTGDAPRPPYSSASDADPAGGRELRCQVRPNSTSSAMVSKWSAPHVRRQPRPHLLRERRFLGGEERSTA